MEIWHFKAYQSNALSIFRYSITNKNDTVKNIREKTLPYC